MSRGQLRVLALAAHAADGIDLAGGTLARYADLGQEVLMVALSLGARSHALTDLSLEEVRAAKRSELSQACDHLGIQHVRSLEWEEDPLTLGRAEIGELVNLIREFAPDIVISHHATCDVLPDHAETGRAVAHALHCAGRPGFESDLPTHVVPNQFQFGTALVDRAQRITGSPTAVPDVYIDITDLIDRKIAAMTCFVTQQYTHDFITHSMQTMEGHNGALAGVGYAEVFYTLRPIVMDELPLTKADVNVGRKLPTRRKPE